MSMLCIATTQFACSWDLNRNLDQAEQLVRQAAAQGAQVILLQELFATPYFCIEQDHKHLALAEEYSDSKVLKRFAALAAELGVVLPLSWFEKAGNAYFNSLSVADADGRLLGVYRKTHIPNAIGYQEKEYFSPGDTGFRVWDTAYGRLGLGICWDQWFPETARCLALMGAEVLLFPTAIGSEPGAAALDSRDHWQMAMRGHAAANILPVIAANRVGREVATNDPELAMSFYGSSFISNHKGKLLVEADRDSTGVLVQTLDLAAMREERLTWGIYRDRRPEMYGPLLGLDGRQSHVRWMARGASDV
ncbi:carbon-nitrogen hydrolase [Pseudomonas taeanensis MS-3]|uniref:Carbon-nitrogen hydrolase n=1 Tax=Pseudomonas taeanensis MS-3 TaxID=1395571 RepID=A0A0A1YK85_9PSED|nr:N-carbamoylputrescine amidase [Pseudomonas taeanensis]KFX69481.1 carbon-nitrogen hydrolase [Pseudomonas taeanensis MS-3]